MYAVQIWGQERGKNMTSQLSALVGGLSFKKAESYYLFPKRLDSNIESKSSNNTYLNIIKIVFLL